MIDECNPGDLVSIPFGGVLRHYGIVTLRGTVLSSSRRHGGVVEQPLSRFANGKPIRNHGRPAGANPLQIEARARRLNHRDYDLAGANCAHYARWSQRRRPTTLQVLSATRMAIGDLLRRN